MLVRGPSALKGATKGRTRNGGECSLAGEMTVGLSASGKDCKQRHLSVGNAALVVCQNAGVLGEPVPFCSCQSSRVTGTAVLLLIQVPRERHMSCKCEGKREKRGHTTFVYMEK